MSVYFLGAFVLCLRLWHGEDIGGFPFRENMSPLRFLRLWCVYVLRCPKAYRAALYSTPVRRSRSKHLNLGWPPKPCRCPDACVQIISTFFKWLGYRCCLFLAAVGFFSPLSVFIATRLDEFFSLDANDSLLPIRELRAIKFGVSQKLAATPILKLVGL